MMKCLSHTTISAVLSAVSMTSVQYTEKVYSNSKENGKIS